MNKIKKRFYDMHFSWLIEWLESKTDKKQGCQRNRKQRLQITSFKTQRGRPRTVSRPFDHPPVLTYFFFGSAIEKNKAEKRLATTSCRGCPQQIQLFYFRDRKTNDFSFFYHIFVKIIFLCIYIFCIFFSIFYNN